MPVLSLRKTFYEELKNIFTNPETATAHAYLNLLLIRMFKTVIGMHNDNKIR